MNKKFRKIAVVGMSCLTLGGFVAPVVSSGYVYAHSFNVKQNNYSDLVDEYRFSYISRLDKNEQALYIKAIKENITTLESENSVYKVLDMFDRYVAYEKGFTVYQFRASFWDGQGITVSELGSFINGAISSAIMAGGGYYVASAMLKREITIKVTSALSAMGLAVFSKFVNDFVTGLTNFVDLGGHFARFIDSVDFHPGNGRINAWP